MKNQIELQKLQMSDGLCIFNNKMFPNDSQAKESLPTIIVEDTDETEEKPKTEDVGISETRSHPTTLRRQSKFTKGAERPKLFISKGSASSRQNQPRVSWQDLSQTLHKTISGGSSRNVLTNEKERVRDRQGARRGVKQSESDVDSGVWSGRSCNDDVDMECSRDRFRRRESYQKAVTTECQGKARILAKLKHKTILETNLQRFSSYSHLPDVR